MMKSIHRNSPKSSRSPSTKLPNTLQSLFALDNEVIISPATKFTPKTPEQSENENLSSTISYCCKIFSFTNPTESPSQQDLKRYKLIQLLSIVKSPRNQFPDQLLPALFDMISTNIFRPLPPSTNAITIAEFPDDEELSSNLQPSWQHLQIIYDILLRLVLNLNPKVLGNYIDQTFITTLLCLFQSDDPRERESLKNVYHRIYLRMTFFRSMMRKSMTEVLLRYVFETEKHPGISELLEIWGSIINGFTVPLKEEHKLFLIRVLIPLHKIKGMQLYFRELSYCVNQFVQKEPMLGGVVVRGILRYWPVTNCQKEVLLIGELEELVENIEPDHYRKLALPLCGQITRCINSWNSQVAERALYVWNNEEFVKMAMAAMEEVFGVVVEGIEKNLNWHWSKSVKQLTHNVKALLQQIDPVLYDKCLQEICHKQNLAREQDEARKKRWERIEMEVASKPFLCVSH